MTVEEVLATTPAWQQAVDRHLFPLAIALAVLVVYLSVRQRGGQSASLAPAEVRANGILVALAFAAFAALWLIGNHVALGKEGFAVDHAITGWARTHVGPDLLTLSTWISEAGSTWWLTLVTFAMGLWQWRQGRGAIGVAAMLASGANGLAIRGLKAQFERIRPEHLHAGPLEPAFSYPSGHAAGSALVYGLLVWLLARHWPPGKRRIAYGLALVLVALIATSRVLLQVHFLSDVIGGLLLGSGILLVTMVWIRSRVLAEAGSGSKTDPGGAAPRD